MFHPLHGEKKGTKNKNSSCKEHMEKGMKSPKKVALWLFQVALWLFQVALWLVPIGGPEGDGLSFLCDESYLTKER